MATAQSSAFVFSEQSGRSYATLTGYSGPITWGTTPVAGDQIEHPEFLAVSDLGNISGPEGTYTFRHIVASTGATEAISHTVTSANSASFGVRFDTDDTNSFDYVVLSGYSGPIQFPTTPVAGDLIIHPASLQISDTGEVFARNATYLIWHQIAATGVVEGVQYTHSGVNTAPSFGGLSDVNANIGDVASISVTASDPDLSDTLSYSVDVLPTGLSISGNTVTGSYLTEQTILSTFTVQDDSGDSGNDSDVAQILFSVARAGYGIRTLTVGYQNLNPDSPLLDAIQPEADGSYDLIAGDQIDYPQTAIDAAGDSRTIGFASDGLMSISGTRSIKLDNVYIRDASNGYIRVGPFSITLTGTGPALTGPLEIVPNSADTSGAQVRFTADEGSEVIGATGNYRLVVVASGAAAPTKTQIMNGLDAAGNPPLFDSGLLQQAATVEQVVTVTGLPTQGAGYWVFLCMEDQFGGQTRIGPVTLTTVASGFPPVWAVVPNQVFNENSEPDLNLGAYVSDFVSITLDWSPPLSQSTGVGFNNGILDGLVNSSDAAGAPGSTTTHTVTATAVNATAPASTTFDVGFYRLNPPVISGTLDNQSWQEGQAINFGLGTAITGAASFELEIDNGGFSDATAELASYGLTFNRSTGVVSGTINSAMPANSPFSLRGRGLNSDGNSAWLPFAVAANTASGAGFFGPIPNQTFNEGLLGSFNASSYFTNAESYEISGLPAGTGIAIDENTGFVTVNPTRADAAQGTINAIVTALNGSGNAQGPVKITIISLNPPVLISAFPNVIAGVGDSFSITPINNFADADSIEVIGRPNGSGLTFDGVSFGGIFTSGDKLASPYPITIRAINTDSHTDDTFLIDVTGEALVDGVITTPAIRTFVVTEKRSLSPKVFIQDESDRIDYAVDLSAWLGSDAIDLVAVSEGAELIDSGVKESDKYMVFVTGGKNGESAKISCRATTVEGRIVDVSFYVAFVDM